MATAETEKILKTAFQPLGNGENALKRLSNPLEMEKIPQNGIPTPWKWKKRLKTAFQPLGNEKKRLKTAFQPLGNGKNASKRLSNPLETER